MSAPRKATAERVSITLKHVYESQVSQDIALRDLASSVKDGFNEVNSKLDLQIQKSGQTEKQVTDHEERIRTAEKQNWKTLGFGAGIGAGVSTLSTFLANALHLTK